MDDWSNKHTVLIVDDQESVKLALSRMLSREGFEVLLAEDGDNALDILREKKVNVMLSSLKMHKMDGLRLLKASKLIKPEVEVILITAHGTIEKAVDAMKDGAYDFVTKPFKGIIIVNTIRRAIEKQTLVIENKFMHKQLPDSENNINIYEDIIWKSDAMRDITKLVRQATPYQVPVFIQGENGTGKETIASFIQKTGQRSDKPFIKVDFSNVPDSQLECELFGNEDINSGKTIKGCFELANKGTLFLDQIEKISPYLQTKLLRVLQEKKFRRLGGANVLENDVHIISATNANFTNIKDQKKFREDLYYLLNIITINIPPLRERKDDIPPLINHFLKTYQEKYNKEIDGISEDIFDVLSNYDWPGNIDELKNVIQKAVVLTQDKIISKNDLPENIIKKERTEDKGVFIPIGMPLDEIEKKMIKEVLKRTKGDREVTAKLLGVTTRTIYRKMNIMEDEDNSRKPVNY
ncbi:MAG: sigma-54-dependent Fis family transcriptional regulator [Candidatus Scalindua sp.]|jgi:two-component system, NtrC family, response regulator HydG|nr:sigma-54-dependent Fis family transcriptional regulator [Candidatus Scalindua sp.]